MKIVPNGEIKLLLEGNLKRLTMYDKFDKIVPKNSKYQHKIDIQKLDETRNHLREFILNFEIRFFI
jgi:thiamine phosphate synthase YjbQ (UPF0047 family)